MIHNSGRLQRHQKSVVGVTTLSSQSDARAAMRGGCIAHLAAIARSLSRVSPKDLCAEAWRRAGGSPAHPSSLAALPARGVSMLPFMEAQALGHRHHALLHSAAPLRDVSRMTQLTRTTATRAYSQPRGTIPATGPQGAHWSHAASPAGKPAAADRRLPPIGSLQACDSGWGCASPPAALHPASTPASAEARGPVSASSRGLPVAESQATGVGRLPSSRSGHYRSHERLEPDSRNANHDTGSPHQAGQQASEGTAKRSASLSALASAPAPSASPATDWRTSREVEPGRLQIWWTPLDTASICSPSRVDRYTACLSAAEAAEVATSQSAEVAAKRTTARALARCVLSRAVAGAGSTGCGGSSGSGSGDDVGGATCSSSSSSSSSSRQTGEEGPAVVLPQDLVFERNAHGKPRLVSRPGWAPLHHNLTHTQDLAGVAVYNPPLPGRCPDLLVPPPASVLWSLPQPTGPGQQRHVQLRFSVGLDVERLDRAPRDPLALARRRLAPAEVQDLEGLSGTDRAHHFMWLWTLKEAYVKARGTGINAPPGLKGFAIGFKDMCPAAAQQLATSHTGRSPDGDGSAAGMQVHPNIRTITFRRTAAGTTSRPSVGTTASPADAASCAKGAGGALACGSQGDAFDSPTAEFAFMLFQPTPRHIAALCLAVQAVPAQEWPEDGQPDATKGHAPSAVAAADGATLGLSGLFVARSAHQASLPSGGADAAALNWAENTSGALLPPLTLARIVEQWSCVPLEAERRLGGAEMVLLGIS